MNTSETIALIIGILLGVCAIVAGMTTYGIAETKALEFCIEKTTKPLECKASFRGY